MKKASIFKSITIVFLTLSVILFQSCSGKSKQETQVTDTNTMYKSVSPKFMVNNNMDDSSIVEIKTKSVVMTIYSDNEFEIMESEAENPDEWEALYDDISFYANEASMFLYEQEDLNIIRDEEFIRFLFTNGDTLTISRKKSVENIFFFNPDSALKQCDNYSFNSAEYKDF